MTENAVKAVLFDLGNVLISWDPFEFYWRHFPTESEARWFVDHVCTLAWHTRHDGGAPMALTCAEHAALFPEYADKIALWSPGWWDMHPGLIEETAALVERLHRNGVALYALTNMPAEKWPGYKERWPVFGLFRDVIVSGEEGVFKPDPAIFRIALERMGGLQPHEAAFADDNARNVAAAEALGMRAHRFVEPQALTDWLASLGLPAAA